MKRDAGRKPEMLLYFEWYKCLSDSKDNIMIINKALVLLSENPTPMDAIEYRYNQTNYLATIANDIR